MSEHFLPLEMSVKCTNQTQEQLNTYAQAISYQYRENAAQWQDAARNLRLPYWDWAKNYTMPDIMNQQTVNISTPSGQNTTYRNPLYTYYFPSMDPVLFPESLAQTGYTLRNPNANQALAAQGLKGAAARTTCDRVSTSLLIQS
jgi:tyrosinase